MGMGKILRTNDLMTGTMTHNILLTKFQGGKKQCLLTRDGVPKDPYRRRHGQEEEERMTPTLPLSYNQDLCIHPPSVECYAIQFSIASDFDPKLMPKRQNQITMRKVCIVLQSLVSRRPDHHSGYS